MQCEVYMAKKLGNGDKLKIQEMLRNNKSLDEIASELDVKPEVINQYLSHVFESQSKIDAERKKQHAAANRKPIAKDAIINRTASKKVKGVNIMTKAASEISDEFNEENRTSSDGGAAFRSRYSGAIGKISDDE